MKEELLVRLSNADAVASKEGEVRAILKEELSAYSDEITYDTLGSISFHKKGTAEKPLKIMFCAHMDEVGFLVRHISDIGFVYLIALGGVQQKSMEMQKVRITTASGSKVSGILNITTDENHHVRELYVDLGCDNRRRSRHLVWKSAIWSALTAMRIPSIRIMYMPARRWMIEAAAMCWHRR